MKKKVALVALSAVLVFSLGIGGTLMLFTAQSETATNVITVGNLEIDLYENGEKITAANPGIILDDVEAGVAVAKAPTVKHTGGVDAYLRVKATLKVYDANDAEVKITPDGALAGGALVNGFGSGWDGLDADPRAFMAANYAFQQLAIDNDWTFVSTNTRSALASAIYKAAFGGANDIYAPAFPTLGYFYYVDGTDLQVFSKDDETSAIFNTITFPLVERFTHVTSQYIISADIATPNVDGSVNAEYGYLGGYTIRIELVAEAVQVDGNIGTGTDYASYFNYQSLQ